jgi:hypothetical protein
MQLQKGPVGLLGALALKVLGRNPPQFGDAVVPTVEVLDQYLAQGELDVQATGNVDVVGTTNNAQILVPSGKCWRVLCVGFNVTTNAADIVDGYKVGFAILPPAGVGNLVPTAYKDVPPAPAGATLNGTRFGYYFPRPLFLPPAWGILFQIDTDRAITTQVRMQGFLLRQQFDA